MAAPGQCLLDASRQLLSSGASSQPGLSRASTIRNSRVKALTQRLPAHRRSASAKGALPTRVGTVHIRLISLLGSVLAQSGSLTQFRARFLSSGILWTLIDLFFQFEWHNQLHVVTMALFRSMLEVSTNDNCPNDCSSAQRLHLD